MPNIITDDDFVYVEKDIIEEFEIIIKTNLSEPFWGKVVNKNKN